MTSLSNEKHDESLFLLHEQPPSNLQQCESFDGIKSIQHTLSASSSTALPNQPYRSLSSHNLTLPLHLSAHQIQCSSPNEIDSFVNQFERRLDNHRHLWEKEYDRKIQQMIEMKTKEFDGLKFRYESKLNELEENHRQVEILSGQINEENQRLKIELEHEKRDKKIEQTIAEQHFKELENEMDRKIREIKIFYENDKQEIKRQHSRIYQDLFEETNQRLKKMENNYKHQQSTNESTVDEMEKRLVDLRSNIEHLQQIKQKLAEEKSQLIKNNEQLQLQVQELTNKQRHIDRDHSDKINRYENELKSVRLRCDSSIDLLHKEKYVFKGKSSQTIDELEKQLSTMTEQFHDLQKLFEEKLIDQQKNYQNNIQQCGNDYETKIQTLKQELKEWNKKYYLSIQQNDQMKINFDYQIQEMNNKTRENEQQLTEKLKIEYEQINQQNEERLRQNFHQEIEEIKYKHQQTIEQMKNDLQQINKLSIETKFTQENDKQQLIHEYEEFIRKLEKQYSQKTNEYEKRIELLVSKTHEQLKTIEDDFETRNFKQQAIINDQQRMIEVLKDEQNKTKLHHEKQWTTLNEQSRREKNEIKAQFDLSMKNLENDFKKLTLKKEQLERKLTHLNEQHKHQLIECRLSHENNMKNVVTNDVRLDLENTIHSLKKQVVYLQQRIAFLQQELECYIQIYGHRPSSQAYN